MGLLISALPFCLYVKRHVPFQCWSASPSPPCYLICKLTPHEKTGSKELSDPPPTHTHTKLSDTQAVLCRLSSLSAPLSLPVGACSLPVSLLSLLPVPL